MYKQELYTILENYITPSTLKKYNKNKKWEYGYNEQHDMVVISKDGTIGDIYEIQNLKIALPKAKNIYKFKISCVQSYSRFRHGCKNIAW